MKAKKLLSLTLAVLLALSLCACSTSGPSSPVETTVPPTTEDPYAQIIAQADALMNSGDKEGAIALYAQGGPIGQQALESFRKEYKAELDELASDISIKYDPTPVLEYLQQLPEGLLDEETAIQWYLELFQPATDEHAERINGEYDFVTFSHYDQEQIQTRIDAIHNSVIAETPEAKALVDTNTFLLGIMEFTFAYETYDWDDPGFATAYEIFASCAEGSAGYEVAQAIDMIRTGKFLEAAEILTKHINSKDRVLGFIYRYAPRGDDQTLNTKLSYTRATDIIDGDVTIKALETMMDNSTTYTMGIIDADGISEAQYSDLLSLTATAPAGKILVLHRWTEFGTGETKINLDLGLMRTLPDEYYPGSLEEVEFVILMDATYERTGAYESGTVRIHETTTLTLYNAAGEELYTETVEGLDDDYMYYFGEAPEYYSAASPDMKAALEQAFALIATQ